MISEGSAFLDRSGRLLAADAAFRALLGLPPGDANETLQRRAGLDPALASLLAGDGPERVPLPEWENAPPCLVSRLACDAGLLLRASGCAGPAASDGEQAVQGLALARLAGSLAHEVKNPLNAMALQLALLGEKIDAAGQPLAVACAGHLGSLKNQINRINEVMRRYLDVADPAPSVGFDGATLLADVTHLFGHEARRRRVTLACEAVPGVRVQGDPARVARLLLGMLWRAITGTAAGGKLVARAVATSDRAEFVLEHTRGADDPSLAPVREVVERAAAELGGALRESSEGDVVRAALVLPKERSS